MNTEGDISLKEQGAQSLQRVLIPDPELSALYPTRDDDFILIATDGLWDVMSSQAAVDHARNLLVQEGLLGECVVPEDTVFLPRVKICNSDLDLTCDLCNLNHNTIGAAADIDSLGEDTVSTRLSQVANNMAVHAVSNLSSQDNVTVLIILLSGGPAGYPPVFENRPALKQGKVASPFSTSSAAAQNIGYTRQGDEKETFSSRSTRSEDIFVSASPDAASPGMNSVMSTLQHCDNI